MKYYFHIDVNSAYLSWQAAYMLSRGYPLDIRTVPAVIGGDRKKRKGIVLAKSLSAKQYGVETGESLFSALKKCPFLEIYPPDYSLYMQASQAMTDLLYHYGPNIQRFSIDEVFMDFIGDRRTVLELAERISDRIKKELGFTVNIGISENKLLAKIASDFSKPDKIHTLFKEEIPEKLWPLPVRDLFMVGSRTEKKLHRRGIRTIGELASLPPEYMYRWLKKPGLTLWKYANGYEDSPVRTEEGPIKSIGNSTTTPYDVESEKEARMFLLAICEKLGERLRAANKRTYTVSVSLSDNDFIRYRKEKSFFEATQNTDTLYDYALEVFEEIPCHKPIRRFAVRACSLVSADAYQMSLFSREEEKKNRLDREIDNIRKTYGARALQRSVFLHSGISPVIGGVTEEEEYLMMSSLL